MTQRKTEYDAAVQYGGKLMGRCTVADSEAIAALMEQCGNSAARVLREYAYFSPEQKSILEKIAAVQAGQNRAATEKSANLFTVPKQSPWGEVQHCETLCPGAFMVDTASHGGIMISKEISDFLSPAARKCGFKQGGYLCFEEDSQEDVALRELLDKKLWSIPDRIKDKSAFEENINRSLREYNPDYWRTRQSGLERAQTARDTSHSTER